MGRKRSASAMGAPDRGDFHVRQNELNPLPQLLRLLPLSDNHRVLIMKKILLKTPLGLAVVLASSNVFASGFALNEQSISGMGSGFAGRSSAAEDASTVFGNPAGMSRLKREQVSLGRRLFSPSPT